MTIQPGVGYVFTSSSLGTNLSIEQPYVDLSATSVKPLTPLVSGNQASATPGTVNRYIPKIGTVFIDATPPPTITMTQSGHICVKCTHEANKFFPRTAEIVYVNGTSPPVDNNTESFYPLASVTKTTVIGSDVFTMTYLSDFGNLVVSRLKAGNNMAAWWWDHA